MDLSTTIAATIAAYPGAQRLPSPLLTQFVIPGFLDAETCRALCAMIDAGVRPSTIADANGDTQFRTSSTCDLDPANPIVMALDQRLSALTGIAIAHGEEMQGQRYDVGQEFKPHTDYFEPGGYDFFQHCANSGNRTWTVMVYLNDVIAGGATRFIKANKIHQPQMGKLIAWDNRDAHGHPNPATLHQAMKVRQGRKYVLTKWYREQSWRRGV